MIQRIAPEEDQTHEEVRQELDDVLDVAAWRSSRRVTAPERPPEDEGAPSWWHGDEDASASFLKTVGVSLNHA